MLKKVVLDTNILLVSISKRSKLHWVFRALLDEKYELCVTTEILNEYAEIVEQLTALYFLPKVHQSGV